MEILLSRIRQSYHEGECRVLARCGILADGRLIMTSQRLDTSGVDCFSPIELCESLDGVKSWSNFERVPSFDAQIAPDGTRTVFGDVTHVYHQKTGASFVIGRRFVYRAGEKAPIKESQNALLYAVYDSQKNCFGAVQELDAPMNLPYGFLSWGSQVVEVENGEVLIPVAIPRCGSRYTSAVVRCGFDGRSLSLIGMSNELDVPGGRGLFEGSLVRHGGRYYLTLRHNDEGYVSVSDDGRLFRAPVIWRWDNGTPLPTYNTQQHFLTCGKGLYLLYTRKGADNDHVFRHRAPLFMAEVDTERMCVLQATERTVIPNRGARLGNFGVTQLRDDSALVIAAEWMQPVGCERYGSDNSIFLAKISD